MTRTQSARPDVAVEAGEQISDQRTRSDRTHEADVIAMPARRRPCRMSGCPNDRPIVPLGCAGLWDVCGRCAGRVLRAQPYAMIEAAVTPSELSALGSGAAG